MNIDNKKKIWKAHREANSDNHGKTLFDRLEDDPNGTVEMWEEQGYHLVDTDEVLEKFFKPGERFIQSNGFQGTKYKPIRRLKFRYVRGDGKFRMGGVLMYCARDEKGFLYFVYLNVANHFLLSVQLDDIADLYIADVNVPKRLPQEDSFKIVETLNLKRFNTANKLWLHVKRRRERNKDYAKGLMKKDIMDYFSAIKRGTIKRVDGVDDDSSDEDKDKDKDKDDSDTY